jgi:hypothetical protein
MHSPPPSKIRTQPLDPDDPPTATAVRELDSRESDGIHVQLLWHPLDGHVSVAVNDSKTGEEFELEVPHGQEALAVYHHPFAYTPTNVPIAAEARGEGRCSSCPPNRRSRPLGADPVRAARPLTKNPEGDSRDHHHCHCDGP